MSVLVVVGSVNVDLVIRVAKLPRPGETVTGGTIDVEVASERSKTSAMARSLDQGDAHPDEDRP